LTRPATSDGFKASRATEQIKKTIEGGLWLDKELWKTRLDLYRTLLQHFRTVLERGATALGKETPIERMLAFLEVMQQENNKPEVRRAMTEAALLARPEMSRQLEQLQRGILRAATQKDRWEDAKAADNLGLLHISCELLVSAASQDLKAFTADEQAQLEKGGPDKGLDEFMHLIQREPSLKDEKRKEAIEQIKKMKEGKKN
jgi:hypothetical protein